LHIILCEVLSPIVPTCIEKCTKNYINIVSIKHMLYFAQDKTMTTPPQKQQQ